MSTHSNPSPKVVVFDLGKVLLEFDFGRAARALSPQSSTDPVGFRAAIDQSSLLLRYESGGLTDQQFYGEIQKLTGYRDSFEAFAAGFSDIFGEIAPMIALQQSLRSRGIPTWIFSNTNDLAVSFIRNRFPFFGGFDGYVLSYKIGSMKPEPASYEAVERATGHRAADILFLDDREENVMGGKARGWQIIHHRDPAETMPRVHQLLGIHP
jgi:putative hydrolase of the HAD superfamily